LAGRIPARRRRGRRTADRKASKEQTRKFAKEAGPAYDSWLRDEVLDIIPEEEGRAFLGLATNKERERYIESFWQRRDPVRESTDNTVKEEH
jgi:hypothetical protein